MEWFPQPSLDQDGYAEREERIETSASYTAARSRCLNLGTNPLPGKRLHRHQDGLRLLEKVLTKACGQFVTDTLMRPRLQRRLGQQPCPFPTFIDGKMERAEWIIGPHGLLKTDYEHHGMGKAELNLMDPAYDLAETILNLTLSPEEESRLIRRYIEESGDASVEQRLLMNKLLAGLWAMDSAQEHLFGKSQAAHRQQEIYERFISASNFLTVHAPRLCGSHCRPPQELRWRPPLLALDTMVSWTAVCSAFLVLRRRAWKLSRCWMPIDSPSR
jgi:hypothetical protein